MHDLELWGGHEATVNRVGERFFDQTSRSGHQYRIADLELFADLGLKALRYPVLWERVSPNAPDDRDFRWTDERLSAIRRLGMQPIVGLVHHGSGPAYTSLVDENFAAGLATHARAAVRQYPWVRDWTPVNEPLTTARFSCLYGLWYPHSEDEGACWLALLNEIDATRLAMREIRAVNPDARLIQTEDLGFCHATRPLMRQAEFENHRRWLTWDLLCGDVVSGHALWDRLVAHGFEDRLRAIADDPCPPDVIGLNHYLSSERFLDHRVELYPNHALAADAAGRFVNVEALRSVGSGTVGLEGLLEQTWRRYGRPLAITECHNGCTRDEQMRWFLEAWHAVQRLRDEGVRIDAVTVWSLLGSYDWNTLVTSESGHYESGVFDLRGGVPRPTALAAMLKALAAGREPGRTPGLVSPGWWRREERFTYGRHDSVAEFPRRVLAASSQEPDMKPILIAGKTGTLGQALARGCEARGLPYILTDRAGFPLNDYDRMAEFLEDRQPCAVINAAGWVRVDDAEGQAEACRTANTLGAENAARVCKQAGIPFVTFSSDLVFDGTKGALYLESDAPKPLNAYGRSKAEAEERVLAAGGRELVVRTAAFFSPVDVYNFAHAVLDNLANRRTFAAASDNYISPTYVPDLVDATLDLLIDGETGIWHLANAGRVSWAEFAGMVAERAGFAAASVRAMPSGQFGWPAPRPRDVALGSERGHHLAPLEFAIDRFVRQWTTTASERLSARPQPKPRRTAQASTAQGGDLG